MSKDQAQVVAEGTNKVNENIDKKIQAYNTDIVFKNVDSMKFDDPINAEEYEKDKKGLEALSGTTEEELQQRVNEAGDQINSEFNKMSEAIKNGQGNTAQEATEQATETAKVQEQSNDDSADKAEIANQQSKNKDLQSKIAEVGQQKNLQEQKHNSAEENLKNVVAGLNQEQRDAKIKELTEQGDTEAVDFINSQPAPQQEAQDPNVMGQTQEHTDQPQ